MIAAQDSENLVISLELSLTQYMNICNFVPEGIQHVTTREKEEESTTLRHIRIWIPIYHFIMLSVLDTIIYTRRMPWIGVIFWIFVRLHDLCTPLGSHGMF